MGAYEKKGLQPVIKDLSVEKRAGFEKAQTPGNIIYTLKPLYYRHENCLSFKSIKYQK